MISIIIVTYNSSKYIYKCLESIFKSNLKDINIEIIIVDNKSKNNIFVENPNVTTYLMDKNIGYSRALNYGISMSKYSTILIVNPDTYVLKNSIHDIYTYYKNLKKESIVGCKILNYNSTFQYSSRRKFPYFKYLIPYIFKLDFFGIQNKYNYSNISEKNTHNVDCASGSFMLFPKSLYNKLNGFDERFFLYFEDTDFCVRAKKIGSDIIYFSDSTVFHKKYGSTTYRNYFFVRFHFYLSFIKFYFKHFNDYLIFNKEDIN